MAAASPSRAAERLAESQDLDQRISLETDSLREKIELKNQEIASKTEDLNKLVAENSDLQLKLDLITNPATRYSLIIDQGGGSFSAYLFAEARGDTPKTLQLEKYKSVKLNELTDPELNEATTAALGGTPMHAPDGTLNDYSFVDPKHYGLITQWFAAFYNNLAEKIRQNYGELTHRAIRQTGKIRAVLMRPENDAKKKIWYDGFHAALGPDWEYKLLSNEEEAHLEGEAFYYFNSKFFEKLVDGFAVNDYIGLGIGSSSTQSYARAPDQSIVVGFNSTAGAKATKAQNEAGKAGDWVPVEAFAETFKAILKPVLSVSPDKKVIVATNAIGFLCAEVTHPTKHPDWPRKEDFKAAVSNGLPVKAEEYREMLRNFVETVPPCWAGNFLLGFVDACCSFENADSVCELSRFPCAAVFSHS
eukprot:INCI17199.1.p1 GENE.INCI17199.1~~INCI17199.1.p1  ORF type:complete len:418 (-),score=83.69 INCI17199.1:1342-2595(-)